MAAVQMHAASSVLEQLTTTWLLWFQVRSMLLSHPNLGRPPSSLCTNKL